ncbi:hypothetical protein F3Y22_tig00110267pilonHSYRG00015 [Hibiscus syriacus]|uniref:Uncharacterized protein n=1 Tax=Hibiscus syriacus TaxID=106335 RepID=A0A6A3B4R4_HIBSY|nr:hypothetical protein F3Y22_tig00110267pilonHSYRG00015 [Hibiscus syriacus]
MSGRRLRHVNTIKKGWRSGKRMRNRGESVRVACQSGKRKVVPGGADPKKLKIWMGKRKVDEIDSDDSGVDEEENEKSVVLNNGNHSDSSKGTEGSSCLVSGGIRIWNFQVEPQVRLVLRKRKRLFCSKARNLVVKMLLPWLKHMPLLEVKQLKLMEHNGTKTEDPGEIFGQHSSVLLAENGGVGSELNNEVNCSSKLESEVQKEIVVSNANITEPEKPLNFNDFNSS